MLLWLCGWDKPAAGGLLSSLVGKRTGPLDRALERSGDTFDIFEYYSAAANPIKRTQLCLGPLIKKLINFMSDMAKLFSKLACLFGST